jgi:hypothetical protein
MTMENVLVNAGDIAHVKPLSKIYVLEFGVLHHRSLQEMA